MENIDSAHLHQKMLRKYLNSYKTTFIIITIASFILLFSMLFTRVNFIVSLTFGFCFLISIAMGKTHQSVNIEKKRVKIENSMYS